MDDMKPPLAFLSRRFTADDVVDAICAMLAPEIDCRPADDLILRPIPPEILQRIREADLLIAIITLEGNSSWIQNELGMAYALGKPILVNGISLADITFLRSPNSEFYRCPETKRAESRIACGNPGACTGNRMFLRRLSGALSVRCVGSMKPKRAGGSGPSCPSRLCNQFRHAVAQSRSRVLAQKSS